MQNHKSSCFFSLYVRLDWRDVRRKGREKSQREKVAKFHSLYSYTFASRKRGEAAQVAACKGRKRAAFMLGLTG
jgi:hypothetical protein